MKTSSIALTLLLLGSTGLHAQAASELPLWQTSYTREATGDLNGALAVLQSLSGDNDSRPLILLREGWLFYRQNQFNAAWNAYAESLALNPDSLDARMGMMLVRMAQERWQEARRIGQQALESGDNYLLELHLMQCEEALKNWTGLYNRSIKLSKRFPSEIYPWLYLARAEKWLGNATQARLSYQQVLRLSPGNQEARLYVGL